MSNLEVVQQLRKLVKPYIGIMPQNKFSAYCIRIEKGICKPNTVSDFFSKFSYFGDWNDYELTNYRMVSEKGKEDYILLHEENYWNNFKKV